MVVVDLENCCLVWRKGNPDNFIANDFGVSRERVRQWKNTFGDMVTIYQLHPEIEKILNDRGAR